MAQPQFPQEAYQVLVNRLQSPPFFAKLANDWGVVPQTVEDQAELLELAAVPRHAKQQDEVKTAGTRSSFLKEAADSLKGALAANGFKSNVPTTDERAVKEAALSVIHDPEIAQAALIYGQYLGQVQG